MYLLFTGHERLLGESVKFYEHKRLLLDFIFLIIILRQCGTKSNFTIQEDVIMGEILKSKYPDMITACRECGKIEGADTDDFIHTFDEIMDLSDEEKDACEWFSENMMGEPFPDISEVGQNYSRDEMMYIFILDNLIEKLLTRKPLCESCFAKKSKEKVLS